MTPRHGSIGSRLTEPYFLNCTAAKTLNSASAGSVVSCKPVCHDIVLCYVCLTPPTVRAMNFVVMISDWTLSPRLSDIQVPLLCLLLRTGQRTTHILQTSLHILTIYTAATGLRDGANFWVTFKVYRSVHHRTLQTNHPPDATIFQFIILTFIYSSTCFGRCPAHHQELNDCSGSLWFYLRIVVKVLLCSWRTQHGYHHDKKVKPEVATAVIELLMMGGKTPETCWAVNKGEDNKLKNCCIRLVTYLN